MLKRGYKLIICVVLVATLLCSFCTSFASAELPIRSAMQRFNAWVASALVAANITIGSTIAPVQDLLDSLTYGSGMPWIPEYTYEGPTWDNDILNRATIAIQPDLVTIDGVTYSDIILSADASQKFRTNAFDLETAWNIASHSEGTYGTGAGFVNGVPVFDLGGTYLVSQDYVFSGRGSYAVGGFIVDISGTRPDISNQAWFYNGSRYNGLQLLGESDFPVTSRLQGRTSWSAFNRRASGVNSNYTNFPSSITFQDTPFDFDWVSGTVPAELLPEGSQLHFFVPSEYTDPDNPDANYNIPELVTDYPDYGNPGGYTYEFDPSLNPDFQLDIDASDALGNIISAIIAAYLAGLIDLPDTVINYITDEPEPQPGVIDPLPDPDPAPDEPSAGTTIANTDWTKLDEILRWIQSTIDSIRHITESLQTMLDSLFDQIQNIIETLQSLPQQILDDIETGPSKVFRKALDILKSLFLPLLLPIKAMMGLWHYVVEWLSSVTAPFLWIFAVMSGTSANMVLPIYAALAGSICIAIYKALGR